MRKRMGLLSAALLCAGPALAQLGVNCGEHPGVLRGKSGIVSFSPDQMEKMATKRVVPGSPSTPPGFHYDGFVTFKILVDKEGQIGCIWAQGGNPLFFIPVNEALQYWEFKPMLVNGKPVEFVGTMKFHVHVE
ncbi:MAG: hypothetical protein WAM89_21200 [Terriglobales bacterium]